jgi:hypothetical protein
LAALSNYRQPPPLPNTEQVVTVLHPKKDIPVGTIKSIERQSGVKLRRR